MSKRMGSHPHSGHGSNSFHSGLHKRPCYGRQRAPPCEPPFVRRTKISMEAPTAAEAMSTNQRMPRLILEIHLVPGLCNWGFEGMNYQFPEVPHYPVMPFAPPHPFPTFSHGEPFSGENPMYPNYPMSEPVRTQPHLVAPQPHRVNSPFNHIYSPHRASSVDTNGRLDRLENTLHEMCIERGISPPLFHSKKGKEPMHNEGGPSGVKEPVFEEGGPSGMRSTGLVDVKVEPISPPRAFEEDDVALMMNDNTEDLMMNEDPSIPSWYVGPDLSIGAPSNANTHSCFNSLDPSDSFYH